MAVFFIPKLIGTEAVPVVLGAKILQVRFTVSPTSAVDLDGGGAEEERSEAAVVLEDADQGAGDGIP